MKYKLIFTFYDHLITRPVHGSVLEIFYQKRREKHAFAEKFIRSLVEKYGKHSLYTDSRKWYDEACNILKFKHYLHSSIEKSLMERVNISRTGFENFDECYPCVRNECNLFHVHNWIQFFISMYNDTSSNKND